jgi:hypothetical protein
MGCEKCFFYNFTNKCCWERHNMPAEGEKCYFFEPQIEVALNQSEKMTIMDILLEVKERGNPVLTSLYEKIQRIHPQSLAQDLRFQPHEKYQDSFEA